MPFRCFESRAFLLGFLAPDLPNRTRRQSCQPQKKVNDPIPLRSILQPEQEHNLQDRTLP
jgi:hypothetical protein